MATNKWSVSLFYWATRFGQKANTSQPVEQKGTVSINKARQCNQFKVTLGLICLQKCTRCHVWGCTHTHAALTFLICLQVRDVLRLNAQVVSLADMGSWTPASWETDPPTASQVTSVTPQRCCPIWIQKLISCKLYGGFPPRISEKNKKQTTICVHMLVTREQAADHRAMSFHPLPHEMAPIKVNGL